MSFYTEEDEKLLHIFRKPNASLHMIPVNICAYPVLP